MSKRRGFTLLELLLTVSTIAVIAGFSLPLFLRAQNKNDLDVAAQSYAQALRRAQVLSVASQDDSAWGVRAESGQFVIFKGTSFVSRDSTLDETTSIPTNMTLSAPTELYFNKLSGAPSSTPSLSLTSVQNDSKTITINAKGIVSF